MHDVSRLYSSGFVASHVDGAERHSYVSRLVVVETKTEYSLYDGSANTGSN